MNLTGKNTKRPFPKVWDRVGEVLRNQQLEYLPRNSILDIRGMGFGCSCTKRDEPGPQIKPAAGKGSHLKPVTERTPPKI